MAALAFLPPIDVLQAFDAISDFELHASPNSATLPIDFLLYVENTWIGRRIGLREMLHPDYPIYLWNCRTALIDLHPLTTNALEGWHNGLKSCIDGKYLTLLRFLNVFLITLIVLVFVIYSISMYLKGLKLLQSKSELIIEHAKARVFDATPRKKYKDLSIRLQQIALDYNPEANLIEYLTSIAYNLRF